MKIAQLLTQVPFYKITKAIEHINVKGLSMDSRSVQPGDLFVCIRGHEVDGHVFAKDAVSKGAVVLVAEEELDTEVPVIIVNDTTKVLAMLAAAFYEAPTESMQLIGVTGTNGKTSITYLLDEIFRAHKVTTGVIGTIQMRIAGASYPAKNTTPDSLSLQQTFARMKEAGVQTAIMEVSSHALNQGRVYGCDFDIAIFTNLSQDHLDYHDNMDDYLRAKSLLFAQLGNSYHMERSKMAVINLDSPVAGKLIRSTAQPVLTYGIKGSADVKAENIHLHEKGVSFSLKTPAETIEINSPLMGLFSVYNMLASASAALASGVPLTTIRHSFEHSEGIRGRFEPVLEGQNFGVVIDYAHTPDSLENVLSTVKEFCRGDIHVVVGCGGDRDRTKRPLMADVAMKYGTDVIFTSDNPRSEDPNEILRDMTNHLEGGYKVIEDRREAIRSALASAEKGDVVLIAGKGHETYQEIDGIRHDFDDREVARELLKQVKESQS
ncbi:UDP-N-acetylmuramoyl-L-alanyl-D-glutamate--2,6-diaminopimelate ligase [Halobacillus salinarum]|uniref:UDP-N-acetylmuramoyl-L-alanyl-D-glutamate--2,6-diaminopimelate ligase n=1 Tax=Halobacillus salinarum TaxID=2932257 RepID=A0ABY4EGF5_9BACI|nr:UDP-N-acetylmuramoyl-L-alanyl-D-glutamate--2,6-diaminopimelate ligase [Halobacillus salinarum]UOQ43137.1 UDP-N-acetylmuramoyl-L-alanyl-D-glutamate--2,6-diaminopimelate ligase [Halobacillus salinarum]